MAWFSANDDRDAPKTFNPFNTEYRAQDAWLDLYHHKFGGRKETRGILNIGASLLLSTPLLQNGIKEIAVNVAGSFPVLERAAGALSHSVASALPLILTGYGAYLIANEVLVKWRQRFLLKSSVNVESSIPPMTEGDTGGLFVGYTTDDARLVGLPDDNLFRHAMIIGQSGMGKTVAASLLMQQQIQRGGGVLFVDGKYDPTNIQAIYEFAAWAGRSHEFYIINPGEPFIYLDRNGKKFNAESVDNEAVKKYGLTKHRNSNTYNPILFGDPDEVASRIMSVVPSTEGNAGSDFFKQSATEALTIIIGAIQAAGLAYSFLDLSILMNNDKALEELVSILKVRNPKCNELRNLRMFMDRYAVPGKDGGKAKIDMKRMKETLGGIAGRMFQFGTGAFGDILNDYEPDIKLYECIRDSAIIYVALPTMGKDIAANNFGKMLLGDFRTAISWFQRNIPDRPKIPFMAFFDEAASYVTESWAVVFEQARSAGVFLLPALQTDSGLSNISEDFKERVVGNNVTKFFFRLGSPAASEMAADVIGKTRRSTKSTSYSVGDSTSRQHIQISPQKSQGQNVGDGVSEREEEVYLIEPDLLRSIRIGECVVSYEGSKIYDLVVPFLSLSKEAKESIGNFKINFMRKKGREGLDFAKNMDKYLSI